MKKHNFSAGPSILPQPVFEQAAQAVLDYNGHGLSILEMSHRSAPFIAVLEETKSLINDIFALNDQYDILFLTGGASTQFFSVPMNYLNEDETALFLDTGTWSTKAIKEVSNFGQVKVAATSKDNNFNYIPALPSIDPDAKYLHLTSNNTIYGTQIHEFPTSPIPVVCDMSSDIMSREVDASQFDLIYAGAQKNLGPAGVTLVLIKKDGMARASRSVPTMLNYETHIAKDSCFNTPPTFPIFTMMLNLRWIKEQGGVGEIEKRNRAKSTLLYNEIDRNALFEGTAARNDRSMMNPTFVMKDDSMTASFLKKCDDANINGLKGHRSVGGFRASMYNALTIDSVQVLVDLMKDFESENG